MIASGRIHAATTSLPGPRSLFGFGRSLSAAASAKIVSDVELVGRDVDGKCREYDDDDDVSSTVATSNGDISNDADYKRHEDLVMDQHPSDDEGVGEGKRGNPSPVGEPTQPHIAKELLLLLKRRSWKKKLMTLVVILSVAPVILDVFVLRSGHLKDFMDDYLEWMGQHPLLGPFSYVTMLVLTSLIFIPPSILIFAAGFTFSSLYGKIGIPVALVSSYVGSTLGGAIGFVRARYMTRDLVEILMRRYPMIRAVDAAIVRNSLRVMILLRLNCLIPFGVLNYVFGITGVSWEAFVLGMVGVMPWHLFLICLGASSATYLNTTDKDDDDVTVVRLILSAMGLACGFIGLAITWKFAKKELKKEVDPTEEDVDLCATDYFHIWVGDDESICDAGIEAHHRDGAFEVIDYQDKLSWNERLLDDFS
ncbi:hypothetical protein ACHAXA_004613 [Cyclostephanos tholiformis]|uniref:VTT domain-containing protein n=1 Tax=Cyclostephanos tholiformis TaxID=382380 RepID=A0ABD3SNX4_9STRA